MLRRLLKLCEILVKPKNVTIIYVELKKRNVLSPEELLFLKATFATYNYSQDKINLVVIVLVISQILNFPVQNRAPIDN